MPKIVTSLTSLQFDRERLHVYQLGLKFAAFAIALVGNLSRRSPQHSRSTGAFESINSIEYRRGNGKRSPAERKRYFEIARGLMEVRRRSMSRRDRGIDREQIGDGRTPVPGDTEAGA